MRSFCQPFKCTSRRLTASEATASSISIVALKLCTPCLRAKYAMTPNTANSATVLMTASSFSCSTCFFASSRRRSKS